MNCKLTGMVFIACAVYLCAQEPEARIARIDGTANVLRADAEEWRLAKAAMPLNPGDQVYSGKETLVEIKFRKGEIVRLDEETKLIIVQSDNKKVKSSTPTGTIWVNMKKISTRGRDFEVSTPTAVAAIRGTVYHMNCAADSNTTVSVYNGKVAVGPADALKKKMESDKKAPEQAPSEVPGPEEIPGPYEVSLSQWKTIVAGQKISVRNDGRFASESFDMKKVSDEFIGKNLELDRSEE